MTHLFAKVRFRTWMVVLAAVLVMGVASAQTLRLATWQWEDPAYNTFWKQSIAAFTKDHSGVTITPFDYPIDQLWNQLNVQIAAGTPPDLIEVTGFNVFQYMHEGVLAPLNKCFAGTDIVKNTNAEDSYAVDGKGNIYALNLSSRSLALFVNTKLFDEAGVKVPTDFASFEAAAKALTIPSKQQFGWVSVNLAHSRFFEALLDMAEGYGSGFTQNGKPAFNSPDVVKGVTFFKKMFDEGVMPHGVKDGGSQYSYFTSGKAAMSIDGPWFWAVIEKQAPDLAPYIKVYPIPTDTHTTTGGTNNLIGIAANSPNYDLACSYIKSLANSQLGQVWTSNSRTIYSYKDSVPADFLQKNPWFKTFADDQSNTVPVAQKGLELYHNDVVRMVTQAGVQILYNGVPVKTALDNLQNQVINFVKDQQQ